MSKPHLDESIQFESEKPGEQLPVVNFQTQQLNQCRPQNENFPWLVTTLRGTTYRGWVRCGAMRPTTRILFFPRFSPHKWQEPNVWGSKNIYQELLNSIIIIIMMIILYIIIITIIYML